MHQAAVDEHGCAIVQEVFEVGKGGRQCSAGGGTKVAAWMLQPAGPIQF
jgi:hypothetical protein